MPGNAALLIDLENFYIGREEQHRGAHGDDQYEFPVDLDSLCQFAADIAGDRRIIVRRAYANFNDRRPGDGERRWDYYLQPQPRFLMEQGIEPVQVFRFPGGSNKNAADMRLAMDATALMGGRAHVELFILVTGDSDFIPLVLELKRSGAEVCVIGVTGCTKPIFERYCDRFEYFEDLLAARELQRQDHRDLEPVRRAMQALLARRSPIKFAAVKPLLSAQMDQTFDASRFDCESTGDFLRRYAGALGITVRRGEHDWEIEPGEGPGAGTATAADAGLVQEAAAAALAGGDDNGQDAADDFEDGDAAASDMPADDPAPAIPRAGGAEHSEDLYRELLRHGVPRCYVVAPEDWNEIIAAVYDLATSEDGEPPVVYHQEVLFEATDACTERGMPEAARKVRDVMFQLFKAGCFHCAEEGAEPGQIDFHWSRPARLAPEIDHPAEMTRRAWAFLVELLARRLEQRGLRGPVQQKPLLRILAGEEASEGQESMLAEIIASVMTRRS